MAVHAVERDGDALVAKTQRGDWRAQIVISATGTWNRALFSRLRGPTRLRGSTTTLRALPLAGIRLCGPFAWRERPDFTCFQAQQQGGALATGVRVELGELWNTTGKVQVGPWAELAR